MGLSVYTRNVICRREGRNAVRGTAEKPHLSRKGHDPTRERAGVSHRSRPTRDQDRQAFPHPFDVGRSDVGQV